MITSKNTIRNIVGIIVILILCTSFVSAANYTKPNPFPFDPDKISPPSGELDDGIEIQNFTSYLVYWNERMDWGLSDKQINELTIKIENYSQKSLPKDGNYFHINNLTKFDEDIGAILGLTKDQIIKFTEEDKKQLELDHQNYHQPPQDFRNAKTNVIPSEGNLSLLGFAPASQSAPYAIRKLYYL